MSDKPKRKWFQIHLSTAIVMMLVAGGLLGLNLEPQTHKNIKISNWVGSSVSCTIFGWPCVAAMESEQDLFLYATKKREGAPRLEWDQGGVARNLVLALVILLNVAHGCEWLIRRRKAARQ